MRNFDTNKLFRKASPSLQTQSRIKAEDFFNKNNFWNFGNLWKTSDKKKLMTDMASWSYDPFASRPKTGPSPRNI